MPLGVYVSRCRGATDLLDPPSLVGHVADRVAVARVVDDLFDPGVQARIASDIAEFGLDALVLGGQSVDHFQRSLSGKLLRERLVDAGVDSNRITHANLLDQVAAPHRRDVAGAREKARAVLDVAALRATMAPAATATSIEPVRSVLVLGVNTEALVAAQRLLQLGIGVVIADRGDVATRVTAAHVPGTAAVVASDERARLIGGVRILDAWGWAGDFGLKLEAGEAPVELRVGGILLAEPFNGEWVAELRRHFKVDVDDDGNARSIHPAAHPAETIDPGIMVVPVRDGGGRLRDKVAAADSAALALVLLLSQPTLRHVHEVSQVDETLCGGCASCVKTCAFGACYLDTETGFSHVDESRCRACGKCVVSCPVGARDIVNSPHAYLTAAIRRLAEANVRGPKVLGFLCGGCGYPAGDRAGAAASAGGPDYPSSFLPLRIPCGGRLDTLYVLEALKQGFDGVMVFRCREGHCHNLIGNLDMDRRINLLRTVVRSRGLDDARLRIVDISPTEGEAFTAAVNEVYGALDGIDDAKGGRHGQA